VRDGDAARFVTIFFDGSSGSASRVVSTTS
jgi:hypothetical protein